jgi:LmbE family N-acetylglucosaminyl deacetylase
MKPLKLLVIFAHPDDESIGVGGTLAKYAAEGVEVHYVCATRGERGWFGDPESNPGFERLAQIRTRELENAVQTLGLHGLHFLHYIDGDVDKAEHTEIIGKLATHIRRIQPQVVLTFPPDGNYGHPDHVAIGQFANGAIVCAADAGYQDPAGLPAHRISKLYFAVDSEDLINLIAPFMDGMTFAVEGQLRGEVAWKNWMITTRIEMSEYCGAAWRAIRCHQSQLGTLGALADMPEDAATAILAMQGAFFRAFSLVNSGRALETDLFEGLR